MSSFIRRFVLLAPLCTLHLFAADRIPLHDNWAIRPAAEVQEGGDSLSRPGFQPKNWYRTTVPSTVVAALVSNKVYPDPNFGMNLRDIPGASYPVGANFSNIPMPPGSPFRGPWWYRTQFTVPASAAGRSMQLHFDGINFRAAVWLNGRQIAAPTELAGAWRLFQFDVAAFIKPGAPNALAVEVFPPTPDDLAITFVDWNPSPPDKGMGIWRDVYLTASGPVTIDFPNVTTALDLPATDHAQLTVTAELKNWTAEPVSGTLFATVGDVAVQQSVQVAAHGTVVASFSPQAFPRLNFDHPRLWWPADLGEQALYDLKLHFDANGTISDSASQRFGIRQVTSELDPATPGPTPPREETGNTHRVFSINGKRILIRGAGYSFDMLLRESPEREAQELTYVRHMHLNTVRLEGKLVDDNFLRLADEYGILITAGWCCCDHWERWASWDDEDRLISAASMRDQIRRLRSHPSVFNWMNGSDNPPPPDVEKMYIGILKEENWANPYESSATARVTSVTGSTGVKMAGPYDYVPPSYWLTDSTLGGAHGFATEISPGPAVPPIESLREMLPSDRLWPVNSWWDYHAGGGPFSHLDNYGNALTARYGAPANAKDYADTSQLMAYEGERAMFEGFGRNKYVSTGVIQWMLNNAWPSVIWHLYDYYLRPGGGYFATRKACEPLHVQYSYDDNSIVVVNSFYKPFSHLTVQAKVFNADSSEQYSHESFVDVLADGVAKAFLIPSLKNLSSTYFLRLSLLNDAKEEVSSNFYWLSTKADELNWKKSTWYYTPETAFADFHALRGLPAVHVSASAKSEIENNEVHTSVTVKNDSDHIAFFIHLKATRVAGDPEGESQDAREEILPVLWSDNYISLLPGEERHLTATYAVQSESANGKRVQVPERHPLVEVEGWNVQPIVTANSAINENASEAKGQ